MTADFVGTGCEFCSSA